MIGQTIPFYRDMIEIARRAPISDRIEVDVDELEWLLGWAAQGIEAAAAAETAKQGSVHESPVLEEDAPKAPNHPSQGGLYDRMSQPSPDL